MEISPLRDSLHKSWLTNEMDQNPDSCRPIRTLPGPIGYNPHHANSGAKEPAADLAVHPSGKVLPLPGQLRPGRVHNNKPCWFPILYRPQRTSNLYMESMPSGPVYPVTGITNRYDNSRNLDNKTPQKSSLDYFFSRRRSSPVP